MRVAGMKGGHVGSGSNSVHGALSKMDNSEALKAMKVGREGEQRGEKRNIDQVSQVEVIYSVFVSKVWENLLELYCVLFCTSYFVPHQKVAFHLLKFSLLSF